MSPNATFEVRKEELRRRVEGLPKEVAGWQERAQNDLDSNAYFSQLQAIGILMGAFTQKQQNLLSNLDPSGAATTFQTVALDLVRSIIRSQQVWDFFRDKLDLRFSPKFKEVLWVADTVTWDCYCPVLENAANLGVIPKVELREPPLAYLTADFSPATWVRGSRPNDGGTFHLGAATLPIPIIEIPWDHVENLWEFMSLHHEVGHDLEADLKLRPILLGSLLAALNAAAVPGDRIQQWMKWQGEIFADLVGLQLGGPAFAETLMHLLLLPEDMVIGVNPEDPHPTHYPRLLMNAAYIPTMIPNHQPLADHGQQIRERWQAIYGPQPQFDPVLQDFSLVFPALMDTSFPALQGKTVRDLLPYTEADDTRIRTATVYMLTGMDRPSKLRPRHCVSAARLAVTQAAQTVSLSEKVFNEINQRVTELVKSNAPEGLRGGDDSTPHQKFIASFADKWGS